MAVNRQGIGTYVYVLSYTHWILSLKIICIYRHISDIWLIFTRLRAGEAVCRAGSNLCGITVSIMRL